MKTAAVLLSAGRGTRMGGTVSKQYLLLDGDPILSYSLRALQNSFIDEIVLVVGTGDADTVRRDIVEKYQITKVSSIVEGGAERYHSVAAGLSMIEDADYIFIQDGARPFLDEGILTRCLESVQKNGACVAGMPVKDTIKLSDEKGCISQTLPRDLVWQIQTPQVFAASLVKRAYERLIREEQEIREKGIKITDDAMVVELLENHSVSLVYGSYENIKITTPEDLPIAEAILGGRNALK